VRHERDLAGRLAGTPARQGLPDVRQGRPDEGEHGIRVHAGRYGDAYLQRATWQPGYTVVTWRGRHVAEPTELDDEEACGYWREVLRVASALRRHYRPVKLNYQTLGNAVPHLHTHLLPRFRQDSAPGRPLPFPEGERPHLPEDVLRADALALRSLLWGDGGDRGRPGAV
jgi:diadenosine tetraphosphate (Ap4A) HIT family hydrolase